MPTSSTASSAGNCAAWRRNDRGCRATGLRDEIRQAISDTQRASVIAKRFEDLDSGWAFPHPDDEALDVLLTAA